MKITIGSQFIITGQIGHGETHIVVAMSSQEIITVGIGSYGPAHSWLGTPEDFLSQFRKK